MAQTTDKKVTTREFASHHFNTPFVEVKKQFNAPVATVWNAWADPQILKQWWGPKDYTCPSAKIDFKIEGRYHCAMKAPDGKVVWTTGSYLEIFPHELIVCTDQFADEAGHPLTAKNSGMGPEWNDAEDTLIFSVKFTSLSANQTEIQLVHEGIPASVHDDCVDGWNSTLDKLKRVVEKA